MVQLILLNINPQAWALVSPIHPLPKEEDRKFNWKELVEQDKEVHRCNLALGQAETGESGGAQGWPEYIVRPSSKTTKIKKNDLST